jgi:hypothetical protein
MDPILLEAGKFTGKSDGGRTVFVGENAGITTHDVEDPNVERVHHYQRVRKSLTGLKVELRTTSKHGGW